MHKKCKNVKGLRPLKGPNQKTFGKNGNNDKNGKGLRPFKRSEPKITKEASKDGCQKGGRRFSILTLSTHHSIYPATKSTKSFEDNSTQERGETFFHKIQSFRALPR